MEKQADSQSNSKVRLLQQVTQLRVAVAVLRHKWVGRVLVEERHRALSAPRPDQTNR